LNRLETIEDDIGKEEREELLDLKGYDNDDEGLSDINISSNGGKKNNSFVQKNNMKRYNSIKKIKM